MRSIRIAVSDYKTGAEIWRGEIDAQTWDRIKAAEERDTGAFPSRLLLDQGLLTRQLIPAVVFAEEI